VRVRCVGKMWVFPGAAGYLLALGQGGRSYRVESGGEWRTCGGVEGGEMLAGSDG
jgi:hypothetical protein